MHLFLNTLAPMSVAFLFEDGHILHRVEWDSRLREYDTLLPKLDELLAMAKIKASNLDGIVCVNGPGSFTGTRTVVLTVNALAYAHGLPVMSVDLFGLGDLLGWPYPRIVSVNGRETWVRRDAASGMEIVANESVSSGTYWGYSHIGSQNPQIVVKCPESYERLAESLVFQGVSRIHPLYVKRPNITVSPDLRRRVHLLK